MPLESYIDDSALNKRLKVVGIVFLILALSLIIATYYSTKIQTGTRGYVVGESGWAKAQKNAIIYLKNYISRGDSADYNNFLSSLKVNEGIERARLALQRPNPGTEEAFKGFMAGEIDSSLIPDMIWLFLNFQHQEDLQEAITVWEQGDEKISELKTLGRRIRNQKREGDFTGEQHERYMDGLNQLNIELTGLEQEFSDRMNDAALWLDALLFWSTIGAGLSLILIAGIITVGYLRKVKDLNRKLSRNREQMRKVLKNSKDVIYEMDLESGQYEYVSPSVQHMLGYSAETLLREGPGLIFERMHPGDKERMRKLRAKFNEEELEEYLERDSEYRIKPKNGDYIWISNTRSVIKNEEGEPVGVVGSVRNISDRKRVEEQLESSLKEKEVLLQEIHHRVKNNLAIISSLLELQKEGADGEVVDVFKESQSRIQSIAMVHEKLYQSKTFSEIDMADYLRQLTEVISEAYSSEGQQIEITQDFNSLSMDITEAVPCGLIYNELLNNVYKHAFDEREEGEILLKLINGEDEARLIVADNGKGLPEDFSLKGQQTLGMTLISTLARQLGGEIRIEQEEGTRFILVF